MVEHLKKQFSRNSNFEVVEGDFMKQNLENFKNKKVAVISNLPYNLTTPIIEKILMSEIKLTTFVFMIQKEVATRIFAKPNSKEYSPLSIMFDYLGKVDTVIKVGKDIYEKSGGTVRILNATGQDYKDLVDLLIMQNMSKDLTEDEITYKVTSKIDELKNNNILNLIDGGEYLARVSSINGMREIMSIKEKCEWSAGTLPSLHPGTNKFYSADGSNLIILNENADNKRLIDKFITYVLTNTQDVTPFVKDGDFFSSYLYTYKNTEIEDQVNNFTGASPLVVMSNVEEKSLPMENYDKYIKIKQNLITE